MLKKEKIVQYKNDTLHVMYGTFITKVKENNESQIYMINLKEFMYNKKIFKSILLEKNGTKHIIVDDLISTIILTKFNYDTLYYICYDYDSKKYDSIHYNSDEEYETNSNEKYNFEPYRPYEQYKLYENDPIDDYNPFDMTEEEYQEEIIKTNTEYPLSDDELTNQKKQVEDLLNSPEIFNDYIPKTPNKISFITSSEYIPPNDSKTNMDKVIEQFKKIIKHNNEKNNFENYMNMIHN